MDRRRLLLDPRSSPEKLLYSSNHDLWIQRQSSDLASGRIADYADDLLAEIYSYGDHDQVAISIGVSMEHCQTLIFFHRLENVPLYLFAIAWVASLSRKLSSKQARAADIRHTYHAGQGTLVASAVVKLDSMATGWEISLDDARSLVWESDIQFVLRHHRFTPQHALEYVRYSQERHHAID